MKFAVFELSGDYAHFKVPESTRGSFTFPFPPRTALMGLIAGILGIQRNSYWQEDQKLYSTKIAVEVLSEVVKDSLKVNYTQTKNITTIEKMVSIMIPKNPAKDRGFTTQFKLDVLRNVKYRVYVNIEDNALHEEFVKRLKEKRYVYPPYLGHVNFFANIDFIGNFDARFLDSGQYELDGLIATMALVDEKDLLYQSGGLVVLFNVPMVMKAYKHNIGDELPGVYSCETCRLENIIFQIENKSRLKMKIKEKFAIAITVNNRKKNLVLLPSNAINA